MLAVAETALTRISKAKAQALAETSGRRGEILLSLVEHQEWLNPTLLVVLSAQLVQSTLLGVLAGRLFGAWGVFTATLLNVTLFFVVAEVAPKTWAIQHTDRAALAAARPIKALAGWGPLQLLSRGLIGLTNVLLPGQGPEARALHLGGGAARRGRPRRRGRGHRGGGAARSSSR